MVLSDAARRRNELKAAFKSGEISRREYNQAISSENLTLEDFRQARVAAQTQASKGLPILESPYIKSETAKQIAKESVRQDIISQAEAQRQPQNQATSNNDINIQKARENLYVNQNPEKQAPGTLSFPIKPLKDIKPGELRTQIFLRERYRDVSLQADVTGKKQVILIKVEAPEKKDYGTISPGFETRIKGLIAKEKEYAEFGEKRKQMFGIKSTDTYSSALKNPTQYARGFAVDIATSTKILGGRIGFAAEAATTRPGTKYLFEKRDILTPIVRSYDVRRPSGLLNFALTLGAVQGIATSPSNPGAKLYKNYRQYRNDLSLAKTESTIFDKGSRYYDQRFSREGIEAAGQRNLFGQKVSEQVLADSRAYVNRYRVTKDIEINSLNPTTQNVLPSGQRKLSTDIVRAYDSTGRNYPVRVGAAQDVYVFDKSLGGWTDITTTKNRFFLKTEQFIGGKVINRNIQSARPTPDISVKISQRQTYFDLFSNKYLESRIALARKIDLGQVEIIQKPIAPKFPAQSNKPGPIRQFSTGSGQSTQGLDLARLNQEQIFSQTQARTNYIDVSEPIQAQKPIVTQRGFQSGGFKIDSRQILREQSQFKIRQIGLIKSVPAYGQSQKNNLAQEPIQFQKPRTNVIQRQRQAQDVIQLQKPIQKTMQIQIQPPSVAQRQYYRQDFTPNLPKTPPEPPKTPFNFKFNQGNSGDRLLSPPGIKGRKEYLPSLEALYFNVRGRQPNIITPFTLRPITRRGG